MKTVLFQLAKNQNHIGHCQLNYIAKNSDGQTICYCLQDNGEKFGGIRFMRCSQDFEPEYEIKKFKDDIEAVFELPEVEKSDSEYGEKLKKLCKAWIIKRGAK